MKTYDNISNANPDIDGCIDVIGDSSWDDYVTNTVIFSDNVVEEKYQTDNNFHLSFLL